MRKFCALVLMVLVSGAFVPADAQAVQAFDTMKSQEELTRAVTTLDAQLFDAYNTCNLERISSFLVAEVQSYHAKGGVTLRRKALTESSKGNICGKTARELVAASLELYPIHGYGAVGIGVHRF